MVINQEIILYQTIRPVLYNIPYETRKDNRTTSITRI